MSTLTYLLDAKLKDDRQELDGRVISRPQLLVTDGVGVTYAVNVNIGVVSAAGTDQAKNIQNPNTGLLNQPWTVLYNVPIARGNRDLIYADVGAAVRLRKTANGRFEVVGFSFEAPGTVTRVGVDIDEFTIGAVEDFTLTTRLLTLGELATMGYGFGITPFGAYATYVGNTLISIEA